MLTLADIFEALTGERLSGANQVITEAAIDSRQVIPGSLFVALPGERVDGHDFVSAAFQNGAHAALVQSDLSSRHPSVDVRNHKLSKGTELPSEPFCILVEDTVLALQQIAKFWRAKLDVRVIGITGSVGKSTTKELVAEVLNQSSPTLKNAGNLNNEIGLPLTLLRLTEGYKHAVLEMGFFVPGEITLLCDIASPQVGVITNVGTVHAERAGSQEVIAKGKSELIQALPVDGCAILNYDDPFVRPMAALAKCRVLFYGLNPQADLWADEITGQGLDGIRFTMHYNNHSFPMRVPLIGQHSVHTALRAAAVGIAEGLDIEAVIAGLRTSRTQLRLVAVHAACGAMLLDDTYNASPESTLAALNLLEEMDGRKVAVLGDMLELGQYEIDGHEKVGRRAAEIAAELVTVGTLGKIIADAAYGAGLSTRHIHSFENTTDVVGFLQPFLKSDDVVLVKGSHGMRMDRIVTALEAGK